MDDLDDLLDCEQDLLDQSFADQGVLLCSESTEFVCRALAHLVVNRLAPVKRFTDLCHASAPLQVLPVNAKGQVWAMRILMMKSLWSWRQLRDKSLQATRMLPQLQCNQQVFRAVL